MEQKLLAKYYSEFFKDVIELEFGKGLLIKARQSLLGS